MKKRLIIYIIFIFYYNSQIQAHTSSWWINRSLNLATAGNFAAEKYAPEWYTPTFWPLLNTYYLVTSYYSVPQGSPLSNSFKIGAAIRVLKIANHMLDGSISYLNDFAMAKDISDYSPSDPLDDQLIFGYIAYDYAKEKLNWMSDKYYNPVKVSEVSQLDSSVFKNKKKDFAYLSCSWKTSTANHSGSVFIDAAHIPKSQQMPEEYYKGYRGISGYWAKTGDAYVFVTFEDPEKIRQDCLTMFHAHFLEIQQILNTAENEPLQRQLQEQYFEYVTIVKKGNLSDRITTSVSSYFGYNEYPIVFFNN